VAATYILDQSSIALKIRRMALEIAERNTDASKIILAGIEPNGTIMSATIRSLLKEWYPGEIDEISVRLNKRHPTEIILSKTPDLQNAVLVLVDDVANSGKTLTYALKPFLEHFPAKIQILVLIDRTHKEFPVKPDYVGLSIATSLEDFVAVELKDGELAGAIVDQKEGGIIL
jgi:pyrimidine operon attenuation protein/uracil phosphoribosyltransferase